MPAARPAPPRHRAARVGATLAALLVFAAAARAQFVLILDFQPGDLTVAYGTQASDAEKAIERVKRFFERELAQFQSTAGFPLRSDIPPTSSTVALSQPSASLYD